MAWNPWRVLRDDFPEWEWRYAALPDGFVGATDHRHRIIWLSETLRHDGAGRRSTLAHELLHVREGHDGPCSLVHEEWVEEAAARELLPLCELLRVLTWAASLQEAADEMNVDTGTLHVRLKRLHPVERAAICRAVALRDNEEAS